MIFLTQAHLDDIKAVLADMQLDVDALQALLDLDGSGSIVWPALSRQDFMKYATLIAFLSLCNLACYPLSVSAVVFLGPTD